jgi:hypothetical protein
VAASFGPQRYPRRIAHDERRPGELECRQRPLEGLLGLLPFADSLDRERQTAGGGRGEAQIILGESRSGSLAAKCSAPRARLQSLIGISTTCRIR